MASRASAPKAAPVEAKRTKPQSSKHEETGSQNVDEMSGDYESQKRKGKSRQEEIDAERKAVENLDKWG